MKLIELYLLKKKKKLIILQFFSMTKFHKKKEPATIKVAYITTLTLQNIS